MDALIKANIMTRAHSCHCNEGLHSVFVYTLHSVPMFLELGM